MTWKSFPIVSANRRHAKTTHNRRQLQRRMLLQRLHRSENLPTVCAVPANLAFLNSTSNASLRHSVRIRYFSSFACKVFQSQPSAYDSAKFVLLIRTFNVYIVHLMLIGSYLFHEEHEFTRLVQEAWIWVFWNSSDRKYSEIFGIEIPTILQFFYAKFGKVSGSSFRLLLSNPFVHLLQLSTILFNYFIAFIQHFLSY